MTERGGAHERSDDTKGQQSKWSNRLIILLRLTSLRSPSSLLVDAAAQLATEFPSLDTFATLSPVPRFRRWFLNKTSQEGKFAPTPEYIFGDDAAMAKFLDCCQGASRPLPPSTSPISHLVSVLEDNENKWYESPELVEALGPILTKLAAKYLVLEKHRGKPVDGVSKFHLSNGAELHRINFLANQTRKGYQTR